MVIHVQDRNTSALFDKLSIDYSFSYACPINYMVNAIKQVNADTAVFDYYENIEFYAVMALADIEGMALLTKPNVL